MDTNRDLLKYLFALEYDFDVCAAKIEAIRIFYNVDNANSKEKGTPE